MDWKSRIYKNSRKQSHDIDISISLDCDLNTEYGNLIIFLRQINNKEIEIYINCEKGIFLLYNKTVTNEKQLSKELHFIRRNYIHRIIKKLKSHRNEKFSVYRFYETMDFSLNKLKWYNKTNIIQMLNNMIENFNYNEEFFYTSLSYFFPQDVTDKKGRVMYKVATKWMFEFPSVINHKSTLNLHDYELVPFTTRIKSKFNKMKKNEFIELIKNIDDNDIIEIIGQMGGNLEDMRNYKNKREYLYNLIHTYRKV